MKKKRTLEKSDPEVVYSRVREYKIKPPLYVDEVLGIKRTWRTAGDLDRYPGQPAIWKLQEDLLNACPRAVKERKAIYVASGHSLGKDFIAGAISLWFLHTYQPSLVVQTAPTDRQVKDIMWKETRSHWERKAINLGGKALESPRLEIEKDWYLVGFTTKDTKGSAESGGAKFQGFKGKNNICVIVTEAQAVEDTIYDQIDAITTSENVLVIFLGNPTRARGRFAKGLRDNEKTGGKNIVFHFSCLDNPNYVEQRTVIPGLADYRWVEAMREKWGEDDPRWIGRVLGKLPDGVLNTLFSDELLDRMERNAGTIVNVSKNRGVSLDPSGDGVDDNVIMSGSGGEPIEIFTKAKMAPSDTAMKAVEMCKKVNGHFITVDADGMGQRDFAELRKIKDDIIAGIKIIPFYGSEPSSTRILLPNGKEKLQYGNLRCEAAFISQERAKKGLAAYDKKYKELREDLEVDEFFERKGVLWLIEKDDIRELLGRSPGQGDCYKMLQWIFSRDLKDETTYKEHEPVSRKDEFWERVNKDVKRLDDPDAIELEDVEI